MAAQYTAQRIADTDNGWLVTDTETEKQHIVFCNASANSAEDAVALIANPPPAEDD
jgi:hypothetical protein